MTEATRTPLMTGGCQCGAVRYAVFSQPETTLCHCRMCQKAVAGPFGVFAKVQLAEFQWTRGRPATFRSSSIAARDFCADCGTPLSFRYLDGDWIELTAGSLDRPESAPPVRQYGIEGRLSWIGGIDALPGVRTDENMPAEQQRRIVGYQHPDCDTPSDWRPRRLT